MSKEFEKFKKAVKVIVSVPKKKVVKKPETKEIQIFCGRCGRFESDHPNKKCAAFARR